MMVLQQRCPAGTCTPLHLQRQQPCILPGVTHCRRPRTCIVSQAASSTSTQEAEAAVLSALTGAKGRGKSGLSEQQLAQLSRAVEVLEADGGVPEPTKRAALDGKWRLLYTSRPGSSSPIQRTFVGVESFQVFQEVRLLGGDSGARVNNIVEFGEDIGYLKVEAEASTTSRPLPGFTPRQGAGIPLFGKSFTYPAARPHMRIDFQFDRAAFYFKSLPLTLPYPVPFKLLGDETKGWIDVTYLSGDGSFRLTRGNKGTLFILQQTETHEA